MKRVLIPGGGFGGIATAHRLKQKPGNDVEVILVDRRPYFKSEVFLLTHAVRQLPFYALP